MEKETEDCQHEYLTHPIQSMYSTKRIKATFPTTILSLQWDELSRLEHIGISGDGGIGARAAWQKKATSHDRKGRQTKERGCDKTCICTYAFVVSLMQRVRLTRDILEPYFTNPTTDNTAAREKCRGDPHVHGRAPFPFSPQDQPPLAACVPRQYVSDNVAKDIPPTEQRPSKCPHRRPTLPRYRCYISCQPRPLSISL